MVHPFFLIHFYLPSESWPVKNGYFEDPDPCYTGPRILRVVSFSCWPRTNSTLSQAVVNAELKADEVGPWRLKNPVVGTVDGRHPEPPGMYKILYTVGYTTNLNWCRISSNCRYCSLSHWVWFRVVLSSFSFHCEGLRGNIEMILKVCERILSKVIWICYMLIILFVGPEDHKPKLFTLFCGLSPKFSNLKIEKLVYCQRVKEIPQRLNQTFPHTGRFILANAFTASGAQRWVSRWMKSWSTQDVWCRENQYWLSMTILPKWHKLIPFNNLMFPSNITNGTAKCITIITTWSILPHRKHVHFFWSNILYSKTEDHNHNAEKVSWVRKGLWKIKVF